MINIYTDAILKNKPKKYHKILVQVLNKHKEYKVVLKDCLNKKELNVNFKNKKSTNEEVNIELFPNDKGILKAKELLKVLKMYKKSNIIFLDNKKNIKDNILLILSTINHLEEKIVLEYSFLTLKGGKDV